MFQLKFSKCLKTFSTTALVVGAMLLGVQGSASAAPAPACNAAEIAKMRELVKKARWDILIQYYMADPDGVLDYIEDYGWPLLEVDEDLDLLADYSNSLQAGHGVFGHFVPATVLDLFQSSNPDDESVLITENVWSSMFFGSLSPSQAVASGPQGAINFWLTSPPHLAQFLNFSLRHFGVTCKQIGNKIYWSLEFASDPVELTSTIPGTSSVVTLTTTVPTSTTTTSVNTNAPITSLQTVEPVVTIAEPVATSRLAAPTAPLTTVAVAPASPLTDTLTSF